VRTYAQNRIDDLARPFWLLDGKTIPDNRVSEGANLSAFISQGGAASVGEVFTCEYFTVRTYKKGSAHVTFTRPDLVEKVNDIIARHYPGRCRRWSDALAGTRSPSLSDRPPKTCLRRVAGLR
jgi:hypothetical protein